MAIQGNNYYARGTLTPWWNTGHRELKYKNEPFNDPVTESKWRELGYTQTKFTGDMYDMRNPEPKWINDFKLQFDLAHFSWSVYRMDPGTVIPEHRDTYLKFKEIYRLSDSHPIARIIVFLEDWQSGHYLELAGEPIIKWRAGDWVCWSNDLPHVAANVGSTPRYTLQITGT